MSRYEKINYDELEMLAANGGRETTTDCQMATVDLICYLISKTVTWTVKLTIKYDCIKKVIDPIAPPEEMHPREP